MVSPAPFFSALQIFTGIGLAAIGRRPLEPFLGIAMALLAALATFRAIRAASTRVTDSGISQLSLHGRVRLPFAEVTGLKSAPNALTLMAHQRVVVVPVGAFENTAEAIGYIESRLPSSVVRA
jgi:hypothetical protein